MYKTRINILQMKAVCLEKDSFNSSLVDSQVYGNRYSLLNFILWNRFSFVCNVWKDWKSLHWMRMKSL